MDDRAWAEFRARVRTRANRQMARIICPFVILVAVLKFLEPMDYPVGDARNSIVLRLVVDGVFIAIAVLGIIASALVTGRPTAPQVKASADPATDTRSVEAGASVPARVAGGRRGSSTPRVRAYEVIGDRPRAVQIIERRLPVASGSAG